MALWTISWEAGSGGERIAELLAGRAGVPLVDPHAVAARQDVVDDEHSKRLPPWVSGVALSAPVFGISHEVLVEQSTAPSARERIEAVILEAARRPCVIADCAAFAILSDHPNACHVRVRAPLEWRARQYARDNCVSCEAARRALVREERHRHFQVRRAYGRALDSVDNFTIVCDTSRLQPDDLVGMLLAAGRANADLLA
jgi:cytidylate kinase